MNINVFDSSKEIAFQIHTSGCAVRNGYELGRDELVRQLRLDEVRKARGLNGEKLTYYRVGFGGDLVRYVEHGRERWWEVVESAVSDAQYAVISEELSEQC